MSNESRVDLCGGKFTYIRQDEPFKHEALRYGEPWRDFTGDKFIYAMGDEIERLRAEVERLTKERDEAVQHNKDWFEAQKLVDASLRAEIERLTREREKLRSVLEDWKGFWEKPWNAPARYSGDPVYKETIAALAETEKTNED